MKVSWDRGILIEYESKKLILDPQTSRQKNSPAFVSHGHLDHAAAFRGKNILKYSSVETKEILFEYGIKSENWKPLQIDREIRIDNLEIVPRNAGHIIGSYQFEVRSPDATVLFTGDFNTIITKTMNPAKPLRSDILIIESTFGSPNFVFPPQKMVSRDIVNWSMQIMKSKRIPVFQTDPLGNAQEIISIFNEAEIPVLTHWKVSRINKIYDAHGYNLKYISCGPEETMEILKSGETAYITPKKFDTFSNPNFVTALVSGWALWTKKTAFALSDHADFPHLLEFVKACKPKIVLTCHGGRFDNLLAYYIEKNLGIRSYSVSLIPTMLKL